LLFILQRSPYYKPSSKLTTFWSWLNLQFNKSKAFTI